MTPPNSDGNPLSLDLPDEQPKRSMPRIPTLVLLGVGTLVILLAVGVSVIFLYQRRINQHRLESANRLRTLGLAIHGYHDVVKHLPSNGTTEIYERNGRPLGGPADANRPFAGSWAYRILPLLELKFDHEMKFPFPDAGKTKTLAPIYHCSMRDRPLYAIGDGFQSGPFTDFVLNPYLHDPEQGALNKPHQSRGLVTIADGTANTIMVGHGWQSTDDLASAIPGDGRCSIYLGGTNGTARNGRTFLRDASGQDHYNAWGSPYSQGAMMCMADGSVRLFAYDISEDLFFKFLHPSDGARLEPPPIEPTDDKKFERAFQQ